MKKKNELFYLISSITDGAWGIYAQSNDRTELGRIGVSEIGKRAESHEGWFLRELLKNMRIVSEKEAKKYGIICGS
jgi:Rod binding domain-containing protein